MVQNVSVAHTRARAHARMVTDVMTSFKETRTKTLPILKHWLSTYFLEVIFPVGNNSYY
jgi:hypothetical protein